jgi:hypothetical protein
MINQSWRREKEILKLNREGTTRDRWEPHPSAYSVRFSRGLTIQDLLGPTRINLKVWRDYNQAVAVVLQKTGWAQVSSPIFWFSWERGSVYFVMGFGVALSSRLPFPPAGPTATAMFSPLAPFLWNVNELKLAVNWNVLNLDNNR